MPNTPSVPPSLKMLRLLFRVFTPIMPNVMGRLAYNMWTTPPKTKPHGIELMYAKKATASFITVDGLKVRVWSWGEGPTVLFLHGWGGRGTQVSSFIEPLNQKGFKVVSIDMPSQGDSEGKKSDAFKMARATAEIIKTIDNLHTVITHSIGGMAYAYSYTPSPTLKNIVMICPLAQFERAIEHFTETLQLQKSVELYLYSELTRNFGINALNKLSLIENAKQIIQPVLIVHDKQDDVVPLQHGKDIAGVLKESALYETNELGHGKILFDKGVVEYIIQFIIRSSTVDID